MASVLDAGAHNPRPLPPSSSSTTFTEVLACFFPLALSP